MIHVVSVAQRLVRYRPHVKNGAMFGVFCSTRRACLGNLADRTEIYTITSL